MGGAVECKLVVGSDAFWEQAAADMGRAKRRLFVQAMTFEGDSVGLRVAAAITDSPAVDRRVLVDSYTRLVVSDRLVWSPSGLLSPALRAEVRATTAMFKALSGAGVGVRWTNPLGGRPWRYPARNHKKLIVADDVAYIGGINFSDHNFAWRDFMLRLEGEAAAQFLADDFEATFCGAPRSSSHQLGELRLHCLDGRANAVVFGEILRLIETAQSSITVVSPYLTFPFTDALARAARRGAVVRLLTPLANNKPIVGAYLLEAARNAGIAIHLLPDMSHEKGILIDQERLVVGSSNFDFVSLAAEEELLAVTTDRTLIADFTRLILAPAMAEALAPGARRASKIAGLASHGALRLAQGAVVSARRARRTAKEWRG